MAFLCIDIGGTNTLFGIGEENFGKVKEMNTERFLSDVSGMVESVIEDSEAEDIQEIAVAAAGPVDREKGVFYPPNIDTEEVQIVESLERFAETNIVNDCSAAVLGEYYHGESAEELLYVTISSGIGAAYASEGELVEGWSGNFAEVGHITVGEELECGCGGRGHWEAYCSGENLTEMAEKLFDLDVERPQDIFNRDSEKANKAEQKFKEMNKTGIADLINLYNPEKIVFGGAVAINHFDDVKEAVDEGLGDEIINEVPEMTLCGLGEIAVLHGLRSICLNEEIH